jgi:hypothetical protein
VNFSYSKGLATGYLASLSGRLSSHADFDGSCSDGRWTDGHRLYGRPGGPDAGSNVCLAGRGGLHHICGDVETANLETANLETANLETG